MPRVLSNSQSHLGNRLGQVSVALGLCLLVGTAWFFNAHPLIAVAAGLLPGAVIFILRQPFLLVLGFVIFSFFRIHEVFPILYPLHIPQLLAMGTLASIAWNLGTGKMKWFWSRELTIFAVFFLLVGAGIPLATNRAAALSDFTETYAKIGIMVIAIAWLATEQKNFKLVARAVVGAGITVGIVALLNKVNGIGLIEGSRVTIGRDLGSMLGDPNDLALVLLFPSSFALAQVSSPGIKWVEKVMGAAGFGVILMAIIATQSRGGLLGIAAVMGVFAYRRIRSKILLAILGVAALAALFAIAGVSDRESGGALEQGMDESALGRLYAWKAALSMAISNPLSGVGLGNFLPNYFFYSDIWDGRNHAVHSTWFEVLAETGFLGLLIFMAMIVSTVKSAVASLRLLAPEQSSPFAYDANAYAMAQAVLAGLVGFMVSGTFLTMGFTWPLYILLALTVGVSSYAKSLRRAPSQNLTHVENSVSPTALPSP